MPRYSGAFPSWTPVAVADATNFTDSGHHSVQGGSSTQRAELREVQLGGQASASAPTFMVVGRDSTVGATLTAGRLAALDPSTTAPGSVPTSFAISTTKPQRSSTLGILLNLSFNAFGGTVRWVYYEDERISLLGNVASLGELSLSAFTGGSPGLLGSHIIMEVI